MNQDFEHLKLLTIGYYIYGILSAIFYFMPLVFVLIGWAIITGRIEPEGKDFGETQAWQFVFVGIAVFLYGQITSIATILVGKFIKQKRRHLFCLIVAGFNCLFFPIGTALGVFTFIVLLRDSVKQLFNKDSFQSEVK